MTHIVILSPQTDTTSYDETAIYNTALSASSFAAHYAASVFDIDADPQINLGWEEVYGPDYPLSAEDVPVLSNGICRVRYVGAWYAWAIDLFIAGVGFQEIGRITTWVDDTTGAAGGIQQMGILQAAEIVEWTPERGVIQVTTRITVSGTPYRMETYISLQRGWTGPRFECYPAKRGSTKLGAHVRFSPRETTSQLTHMGSSGALGGTWPGGGTNFSGVEPWHALSGLSKTVGMAVMRTGVRSRRYDDTTAYGSTRKAFATCADQSDAAVAGYVSARIGVSLAGFQAEAETWRHLAGTATQVSDGAATGGLAVEDTQTASTNATVRVDSAFLANLGLGTFDVSVLCMGIGGDQQISLAAFSTGSSTATNTAARTSYQWAYLGAVVRDAASDSFSINAWRAGTSTAVRLDRFALVPVERRQTGGATYDGVRDMAFENLYDSRAIPELVGR